MTRWSCYPLELRERAVRMGLEVRRLIGRGTWCAQPSLPLERTASTRHLPSAG